MMMHSFQDDTNNWDLELDYTFIIDDSVHDGFREKVRREKMNDRFTDLSAILEPGRPAKSDKSAIISDAIRAVNQLRSDAKELRDTNKKLREEIKNIKVSIKFIVFECTVRVSTNAQAEKHELRGDKNLLKTQKVKIEQLVKASVPVPAAFPMWQWISLTVMDITQDHVLRPPVA